MNNLLKAAAISVISFAAGVSITALYYKEFEANLKKQHEEVLQVVLDTADDFQMQSFWSRVEVIRGLVDSEKQGSDIRHHIALEILNLRKRQEEIERSDAPFLKKYRQDPYNAKRLDESRAFINQLAFDYDVGS